MSVVANSTIRITNDDVTVTTGNLVTKCRNTPTAMAEQIALCQTENARLQKALGWDYPHPAPPELLCDGTSDANLTCDENAACDGIVTTADYDGDLDFGGGPKQGESK